eukprot:Phypoly_transcript_05702.p1 GENE.Phypoly_transcript_05702~~Phypoly_transcript_05702.p1  ORF type:complete len:528 (+),score=64.12 Phypoly_transcript_05702:18-1601(+)
MPYYMWQGWRRVALTCKSALRSNFQGTCVLTQCLCTTSPHPEEEVRVRYAPSPTGFMHLGGLRTALYNYLVAKKNNGKFILRIEDTDRTRFVPGATADIIKTITWAGLEISEGPGFGGEYGPYVQSERTKLYQHYAKLLLENGHAYRCFCTGERLAELRNKQMSYDRTCLKLSAEEIKSKLNSNASHTIRLKVPHETSDIIVKDMIHGDTVFSTMAVDDQVLLKSDGFPTYHLACVVDDHLMKISHVIRGEEWLSSTPKHLLLYRAFGWTPPCFAHLPLLLNTDKTKLSKRHGHASVESYIKKGYLPNAVVNFVALLGWGPPLSSTPTNQDELFYDIPSLVQKFSLSSIVLGGCVVSMEKLYWVNTQHIQKMIESTKGFNDLIDILHPIINTAVLQHIEQPFYNDPNSLYFMKTDPSLAPPVSTTPKGTPPPSKVVEDLPTGTLVEKIIFSPEVLEQHPLLVLLKDREYVRRVIFTVRERLHVVGDIAALSIPFFVEPSFVTANALEMRRKFWNSAIHLQILDLYKR